MNAGPAPAPARRCRRAPRPVSPGAVRPSDLLGAFFAAGIGYLVAAVAAQLLHVAAGWAPGRWLALHLAFVGGVSQLVLGAGQFFAGAFLATDPPRRAVVRLQLATWNAGAILVPVGVVAGPDALVVAGAACLAAGLLAFAWGLERMRRSSLQRVPWAVRWYEAGACFLGAGAIAGVLMQRGVAWSAGSLLGVHLACNLAGWFGTAIVGTLHTFFPSLTQTRLRWPGLQRATFACWTGGTAALAGGYAVASSALCLAGWALLLGGAVALGANVAACLIGAPRPLGLPARLLAVGQACLLLGIGVACAAAATGDATAAPVGETRAAVAALLLVGWLGPTVVGSLLHLLAVLARVRDLRRALPAPRPLRDLALAAAVASGALVLAASHLAGPAAARQAATVAVVAAYAVLGALALARLAAGLRAGRPRV